jgi:hypothetical protein
MEEERQTWEEGECTAGARRRSLCCLNQRQQSRTQPRQRHLHVRVKVARRINMQRRLVSHAATAGATTHVVHTMTGSARGGSLLLLLLLLLMLLLHSMNTTRACALERAAAAGGCGPGAKSKDGTGIERAELLLLLLMDMSSCRTPPSWRPALAPPPMHMSS